MVRLFRMLRPYRVNIGIILVLLFMQTMSDLYLPTLMADIVDRGIVNGDIPYILKIGVYMLLVTGVGSLSSILATFFSAKTATGFGKLLRAKVFAHVENFSLQEFERIGTASLITRTTNDITQLQQVLTMMLRIMVMAPMMAIGGIIMAVSKDVKLSSVLIIILMILIVIILVVVKKGLPLFKAMQVKLDRLNLVFRENLTGIRVIRAFDRIDYEKERFNLANLEITNTALKVNRLMGGLMPLMMLIMNFSAIAIVWFGGIRIENGGMQVGDLMAFIQYAMQIMFSLIMVSYMFVMLPRASVSAGRINEVLDMIPQIKDQAEIGSVGIREGYLEFKNVTFSYPGAEKPAISNVSFSAGPGTVTAIIGGTGSGKSTLVSLIPRLYQYDAGRILIDGVKIEEISLDSLRQNIGFVPQQALLFTGSIADNIRYGKAEATDEEVRRAAEIAQASQFILDMQDGFDSVIAQGGTNLSGGQKQRLSIARALVRQPKLYIFDDSFSALDFKTDAKLRAALKQETVDSTVLIVTQRVATVIDSDQIIVLDEGAIAGIGQHRELLSTCRVYREIVSSQLSEEELA